MLLSILEDLPQEILYDNMKQVVIKRTLKVSDSEWNSQFEDFFKCFGFIPRLYSLTGLKQKAKLKIRWGTSRGISSLEERSTSLEDLNVQVHVWLERVNSTVHGTTYQILLERFKEEKLNPLGKVPPYKV